MRKSNTQPLGEIIQEYLNALKINKKIKEVRVINQWEEIIGTAIAKRTDRLLIKNKILFIYMNSSVARNELMMIRDGLKRKINERAGEELIHKIVVR